MKFIITMKGNSPEESPAKTIDASNTNVLVDNFGIKNGKPCLTMSSLDTNKIEIISFEDIDFVTTSKGKVVLDHTKPQDILVEEFKNIYEIEDAIPLKIVFTTGGDAKVWVTRRTTIDEAFALSCIEVPLNQQPKFTIGEGPEAIPGDTPLMADATIAVTFEPKKFDVTLKNFDGKEGVKLLPKIATYGDSISSVAEIAAREITANAAENMVARIYYGDEPAEELRPDVTVKGPINFTVKIDPMPEPM